MGRILVGTASWTHRSLLESGWYPGDASDPAKRLAYYASRFPVVEVDATYYHPPSLGTVRGWRDRTPPGFTFDVKAFSLLTGHPTRPASLYKDLQEELGAPPQRNLYLKDVPPEITEEVWWRFLETLEPLHASGRLGAVLFQFPPWFPIGEGPRRYVLECARRCAPMRISVEFRNHTWMDEDNREETLAFLAEHDLPYVGVDMPQGHASSMPPILAATSDLAVVRLHGHSERWTSKNIDERFRYLYSEDELRRWAARVGELSERAKVTHVLFNNCCADNSQRNASRFRELVGGLEGPARWDGREGRDGPEGAAGTDLQTALEID
ncbi:DUF72 domain-containing protein [Streptosporangium sp. NPDC023615]|uniref:DUF72 domain-containing protein n=1 Tax=Streptosporangium sp. NPDC023615 TaxID=3154794 RepID=UPI00342BCD0B